KAIRNALGMTMQQLATKLKITKQGISDIEKREREGAITIKALKEVGRALDMKLVYGFVPMDGTLESLVEKKAREIATTIVMRTANTMELEAQGNSKLRLEKAIEERTKEIVDQMPGL